MLFALKETFKKASITALKAATTRTEAATKVMKTAMTAASGTEAATRATKTAMKAATTGTEAVTQAMKTTMTAATSGTEAATKATNTAMKAAKTGTEAAMKATKTALKAAKTGTNSATTKATKSALKAATTGTEEVMKAMKTAMTAAAGEEAATRATKTALKAATTGTEAAMKTMKITMTAATSGREAATKATNTAMKAAKTGTEAAMKTTKTAMKVATKGTEAAMKAMKKTMTEGAGEEAVKKTMKTAIKAAKTGTEACMKATNYVGKTAKPGKRVVLEHITESNSKQKGASASDTEQLSDLNETLHVIQKRIHELQNDVKIIRKRLTSPDLKENVRVLTVKNEGTTVAEDVYHKQNVPPVLTTKGAKNTCYTVGDADLNKGADTTGNKYVEIWVLDGNGTARIPINESSDTQTEDLIQRIIQFLRRLMGYIDIETLIKFINRLQKNKRVKCVGKCITKVCLNTMIPGSKIVLDLADGIYHIYKGNSKTGVLYLVFAGMGAYAYPDQDFDALPISTVEVDANQSVYFSIVNVESLILAPNVETFISTVNVETPISTVNVATPISTVNVETPISTVNVATPISTVNVETPISTVNAETLNSNVNVKTEYAIFVAVTPKDDRNS